MLGWGTRFGHRRVSTAGLGSLVLLSVLSAGTVRAATYTVTNTNDNAGAGTLRTAITNANANVGVTDTIAFNITGAGPHTITLTGALPTITDPVIIDGSTQPGYAGTPIIELSAANCGAFGALDLRAGSSGSTIRGLVVNRCPSSAIRLLGTSNNVIAGNFLGTDVAGTAPLGNNVGVYIGGSATATNNNRVGGTVATDRNVISGNTTDGVQINPGTGGAASNRVEGNYIGLDVSGTVDLGNGNQGVGVFSANANTGNVIGGTVAGARNVISGNGNDGVLISGATATGNRVEGNYIGTNAAGTAAIPNLRGIEVSGSANGNTIGGPSGFENVISGNTQFGVLIDNAGSNTVAGNYVGTNAAGTGAVGNVIDGIYVTNGAANNVIGGTTAAARNIISGNGDDGLEISGAGATGRRAAVVTIGTPGVRVRPAGHWMSLAPEARLTGTPQFLLHRPFRAAAGGGGDDTTRRNRTPR